MNSACRPPLMLFALIAPLWSGAIDPLAAQQLRIETDVYVGDEIKPVSHTVTLFDSNTVYDFLDAPNQIVVFRPPGSSREGQFILLDLDSRRRTDVKTDRVEALMKKLTRWAASQEDKMLKFSAEPDFEESFDIATGLLTLESDLWDYTVATVPAEDEHMLARYREFVDWYTRLSTMVHSAPPPGPRLALNAALAKHGVVPVEIRRRLDADPKHLRATHLFAWRLSRDDRARIDEAREHLANFEKVDNQEFLARRSSEDLVRGQSR